MSKQSHLISREIGIDAGHRVTFHGSKCRSCHGHRYRLEAWCSGPLHEEGEQQGMVLDFGFLKELMMEHVDAPCDHGMILWVDDPLIATFAPDVDVQTFRDAIARDGFALTTTHTGKLYVTPFVPTAENLARHWFNRLELAVVKRSGGLASLEGIKVWETPNCWAAFGPIFESAA